MTLSSEAKLPRSVQISAGLLTLYGLAVLVNALVLQQASDWVGAPDFPRAVIRFAGVTMVAWGLLNRARWAWWLAVVLPIVWLVSGGSVLAILYAVGGEASAAFPQGFPPLALVSALALLAALLLILSPAAREAFRRPLA